MKHICQQISKFERPWSLTIANLTRSLKNFYIALQFNALILYDFIIDLQDIF